MAAKAIFAFLTATTALIGVCAHAKVPINFRQGTNWAAGCNLTDFTFNGDPGKGGLIAFNFGHITEHSDATSITPIGLGGLWFP